MNRASLFFLILFFGSLECARILCIASIPTFSHSLFFQPIWRGLADRGHDLTVVTHFPNKEGYANIKEVDISDVYKALNKARTKINSIPPSYMNWPQMLKKIMIFFNEVAVLVLEHPEMQKMINNETEHFDLVIAESHIAALFGFAHRFKSPLVGISSVEITSDQHHLLGNPIHPLLYPEVFVTSNYEAGFVDRSTRIYAKVLSTYAQHTNIEKQHSYMKKYFGNDVPKPDVLIRNMHFAFVNTPVFNSRPLGPRTIAIGGGAHIGKSKPLPKDLEELLEKHSQGVIYFSMGTNVKLEQYPADFMNKTIAAFQQLPFQVICKFSHEIPVLPSNVKAFNWLPQQDLLRHKNMKAFITQAGLHSKEESINAGVPMIVIPFMTDQYTNAAQVVDAGLGVKIDKDNFSGEELKRAILEVAGNPIYKKNTQRLSNFLQDQPMSGLQKAIWYTEYALRHKNDLDLMIPPMDNYLPLYQYLFLDLIGIVLGIFLIMLYIAVMLSKLLFVKILKRGIINNTSVVEKCKKHL